MIMLKKALPIAISRSRTGVSGSATNRVVGMPSSQCARTASVNRLSLSPKWLYTVSLETPASVAIWSMLTRSKPWLTNSRLAASRIAARLPGSFGRPGPAALVSGGRGETGGIMR